MDHRKILSVDITHSLTKVGWTSKEGREFPNSWKIVYETNKKPDLHFRNYGFWISFFPNHNTIRSLDLRTRHNRPTKAANGLYFLCCCLKKKRPNSHGLSLWFPWNIFVLCVYRYTSFQTQPSFPCFISRQTWLQTTWQERQERRSTGFGLCPDIPFLGTSCT